MRIIGMMIIGPNEKRLKIVLDQRKELVDDMVIVGNNIDEGSEKLIKSYGFWYYRDDREWGYDQPKIKNDLLQKVAKLKPDWILPSDADEIYDKHFTRKEAERLASLGAIAWYFAVLNLWDDEDHYRHDMSFWNIRYFKYKPELGMQFERKNVHPGWAPPAFYTYGWHAPFILKHYGILDSEDRKKKSARYEKYDPKNTKPEYYDKLKGVHEMKPLIRQFDDNVMHNKIVEDIETNFKYEDKKHV